MSHFSYFLQRKSAGDIVIALQSTGMIRVDALGLGEAVLGLRSFRECFWGGGALLFAG